MAKRTGTKVITNEARMSYAHVFEPRENEQGESKYSVSILIPKDDEETITLIEEAIEEAKQEGRAKKWGGKIPANLKTPLRDGDEERPDDEAYAGHYFFNATSTTKPQVVKFTGQRDKDNKPIFETIESDEEFYSGCYAKASVNFYAFNKNGNKGIAAGLNNLLKTRDGERLAGGASAEEDFEDVVDDVAEYDDEGMLD